MHLIGAVIIGLIVGLLARFFKPGRDPMGLIWTAILGIIGSLFATFMGRWMGIYTAEEPAGFLASLIGAIVVLAIAQAVRGKRGDHTDISNRRAA